MKVILYSLFATLIWLPLLSGQENLEIEGVLRIGNDSGNDPTLGIIRFNETTSDFEGWNGYAWISLTRKMQTGTISDIDGNSYSTKIIAGREWMINNLRTTKYQNGVSIPDATSNSFWTNATAGVWCWYENLNINDDIYGKLYNWLAVSDNQGLCPTGWRIPSEDEWTDLTDYLGGVLVSGGKMKKTNNVLSSLWESPNTGASNESGFSGLPGGYRNPAGTFLDRRNVGFWWSSSQSVSNIDNAQSRFLSYNQTSIGVTTNLKKFGFSVRCIKQPAN
ncbi:MAG: fibrobacter succinogenes major paralogous domain-containing protein [Saprospiraceae bacterium]|nr:fibrobacter succinogenes major paralogous domain-containing protein [Saprospiraceae bacterium]